MPEAPGLADVLAEQRVLSRLRAVVETRWVQVIDAEIIRKVTGWLLPGLASVG